MVEYLIRLIKPHHKVATISRGYGRMTKGFRIADPEDSAATMGDEPFQFYRKFQSEVVVAVGEERALAVPLILQEREEVGVIILDDSFQHRRVSPSYNILLSDYNRPFYKDLLLPAGRLRESRAGASKPCSAASTPAIQRLRACSSAMYSWAFIAVPRSMRVRAHGSYAWPRRAMRSWCQA